MERASLDIFRDEELLETVRSFSALYEHHKGFKERDAMKKYMDGVTTALQFIFNLSHSFGLKH